MKETLGIQTMLELYGCDQQLLDNIDFIKHTMLEAAKIANATVVQQFFHQFSPYGISGTVVISESHINIHTWPEHNYAAVDIFTCSMEMNTAGAVECLQGAFKSHSHKVHSHERGNLLEIKKVHDLQTQHHRQ